MVTGSRVAGGWLARGFSYVNVKYCFDRFFVLIKAIARTCLRGLHHPDRGSRVGVPWGIPAAWVTDLNHACIPRFPPLPLTGIPARDVVARMCSIVCGCLCPGTAYPLVRRSDYV
ncbi:hypothetical protein GCM10027065_28070 [Rhodanobacter koreensis]